MPKITYPRPCLTCGQQLNKGHFSHHKKRCGATEHRYHCQFCPLSFTQKGSMQRHVRQQHSNNPLPFPCTMCGTELTRAKNLRLHMETVHADQKPCFGCWFFPTAFTRKSARQNHMRRVHGRICREQEINLHIHLQHLSEEEDFQNEWMFLECRPIQPDEHNVYPCGQTPIQSYFFIENNINGNRTFVGSGCTENAISKAAAVIGYFKHILHHEVQGIYKGQDDNDLQTFRVKSNTILVRSLHEVEHLDPPLTKTLDGQWQVSVMYSKAESLLIEQMYFLRFKEKYVRGCLQFTAV